MKNVKTLSIILLIAIYNLFVSCNKDQSDFQNTNDFTFTLKALGILVIPVVTLCIDSLS